jgi:hypothetical protein
MAPRIREPMSGDAAPDFPARDQSLAAGTGNAGDGGDREAPMRSSGDLAAAFLIQGISRLPVSSEKKIETDGSSLSD